MCCRATARPQLALQTKSEPWLFAYALHRRNRCCFIGKRVRPARTTAHACSSHGRFARAVFWTRRSRASFALFARASCTHLSAAVRTGRAHLPMKYENDSVMNAQASQATRTACSASRNARCIPTPGRTDAVWLSVQEAGRNAGCSELRSGAKLMCMWWPASNLLQLGEWPQ